jgi:hypothetical protein
VLDAIDVDVVGGVEVVTVEVDVVVEDAGADEGVTTVVGVLVNEQELMNKSAAIATLGRLNDRKGSLSPFDSRRGLTGLPPIFGGSSKHTLRRRRMRRVVSSLHIHPDKGHPRSAYATTLSTECQQPSNWIHGSSESMKPVPPCPNLSIAPSHQSLINPLTRVSITLSSTSRTLQLARTEFSGLAIRRPPAGDKTTLNMVEMATV